MPHDQLIGAIACREPPMDLARIAGALSGAGLFAALGLGPAYVAIVGLYVVSTMLTLCVIAPSKPHPVDEAAVGSLRRSPMRDLKEGVAYVWTTPRHAGGDLDRVPDQPDRLSAVQRPAALYRARDLWRQPDRARISVGRLRGRFAGRIGHAEHGRRHPRGASHDRRDGRYGTSCCCYLRRCRACRRRWPA